MIMIIIIFLKVEEVEIITDLDIVEAATLEYKLPGYRALHIEDSGNYVNS